MEFDAYQNFASLTRVYPEDMKIVYPCLGLSGEVGEVCEKVKKIYRDKGGTFSETDKEQIAREMGDVLWYLSALASDLGKNLNDIAFKNTQKILERKDHGKINGNGDYR